MNVPTNDVREEEHRQPPIRPPVERWAISEPNPSWVGALLTFLRGLNGPILVAVLAVAGMVYLGAPIARAEKELPTPGVVGCTVSVGLLAVIVLMALYTEGKNRHAKDTERSKTEAPDA